MKERGKSARTREHIIRSAAPIFNMKGFAGTSLFDLTEATGLTKGAIYGHFENKQEIAVEVFEYNLDSVQMNVRSQMAKATSSREKLLIYAQLYRKINTEMFPKGGCPILNTAVDADDTNPELKAKVSEAICKLKDRLAGIVSDGIAAGEFKKETDPVSVALALMAIIEGGVMIRMATGRQDFFESILRQVTSILDGITVIAPSRT